MRRFTLRRKRCYTSLFAALETAPADATVTRRELARWQCAQDNVSALSVESGALFVRFLAALESNGDVAELRVVELRARLIEALQEDVARRRPRAPGLTIFEALDPDFLPPQALDEWLKWYDHLVFQVTREDELVHQRVTWLMQFEGFLFTAFGFILAARTELTPKPLLLVLLGTISMVGFTGAFAVQRGVRSAHLVLDALKRAYLASFERFKATHVRPFGKHSQHRQLVSAVLPWTLMSAWLSIQLMLLYRLVMHHWNSGGP
jgi:hypothetical protein